MTPPPSLFTIASLLLRYPSPAMLALDGDIGRAVAALGRRDARRDFERFLAHRRASAPIALEQEYVETFDLRRRCTLNVSYYLHGDTRRRGVALLRLRRMYEAAGMVLESAELPDHLPVMLEFAAGAEPAFGAHVLGEYRIGLELLRRALHADERPHAAVLDAVCGSLPRLSVRESAAAARLAAGGPPDEQVGLEPFAPPEVMPAEVRT
jgi:nitrate reductase delta subunit